MFTALLIVGGSAIALEFCYMGYVYFCGNPFK
jgi:hypothetical protein